MPKSKGVGEFRTVRQWAVVDWRGRIVREYSFPLMFGSKSGAKRNATSDERVVCVEIREVCR